MSNIVHAGLGMCEGSCKRIPGCTYINYNRCTLMCDLMTGNDPNNELDLTLNSCMIFVSLKENLNVSRQSFFNLRDITFENNVT